MNVEPPSESMRARLMNCGVLIFMPFLDPKLFGAREDAWTAYLVKEEMLVVVELRLPT
jgi:hypothetical protein